jgi:hypothetical protein
MPNLLLSRPFAVSAAGSLVVLRVVSSAWSLEFHVALMVAAALRYHARLAKLNAGIDERGFHTIGVLHDATAPKPKRKRFIDKLPELLRPHRLNVRTEGAMVMLSVQGHLIGLTYKGARTLSQWMRVRGKEAKRNAGEPARWDQISQVASIEAGERPWL